MAFAAAALALACAAAGVRAEDENDGRVPLVIKATDPNGGKLSFKWRQLEGPTVKLSNPTAARFDNTINKWISDPYFIPTEPGKYVFEVVVTNEDGVSSQPKHIVREVLPPTPPPTAVAGADQNKTVGEVVVLNGIGSKAANNRTITEWEWKVIDAPEKFNPDPKKLKERQWDFKVTEPGKYQFELRVFDGKRWSDPARCIVNVARPSAPPIVAIDDEEKKVEIPVPPKNIDVKKPLVKPVVTPGKTVKVNEQIVLDGSASQVDKGLEPRFFWRLEKGPLLKTLASDNTKPFDKSITNPLNYPVWTCTPNLPGQYTFVLEITYKNTTGSGAPTLSVDSEPVVYNVVAANQEPVAHIFAERTAVEVGDFVKLDGSKSKDPENAKLEFIWGNVPGKKYPRNWRGNEGPVVEFKAEEEGTYAVALVVSDGVSRSKAAEVTITVGSANQPPVVKLKNAYECAVGEQVRLEAEVSDPENDATEKRWSCVDPADLVIPDKYASNETLIFKPNKPGAYLFKIVVTDAKGRSVTAQTTVTVKDAANRAPTAVIDGPKAVPVGAKVKLSGARSSDPEGKTLTYYWKQEGGPKIEGDAPAAKEKGWEFVAKEAGDYTFSLIVSDGASKSAPERFAFTASKQNHAPEAKIAPPAETKLPVQQKLLLDGSASVDGDGDKLTYKWAKIDGKGDVEIAGANQDKAAITGTLPGPVKLQLVVNDGSADSAPAIVELLIVKPNNKPEAKISGPMEAKVGAFIELTAKGSTDPDGDELSYIWSQPADGGPETGLRGKELRRADIRFKPEKPGTYVLNLEVVDAEGLRSESVSHKVEVKGLNRPPRAVAARADNEPVIAGKEVKLSARGSLDPEGGPLTYKWIQLSGAPITLPDKQTDILNVVPPAAGEYEFECIVNDGENDSPAARVAFAAKAPNRLPVAVIGEITPCEPGGKITLDGTASNDPDGDKLEYKWTKVSGPDVSFGFRGAGKPKVEVELKEGEYVFELKVSDGKEWSEPTRAAVKTRAPNVEPVAAFVAATVRTEENVETVLDASLSSDPDNGPKPLTFAWRQLEGDRVILALEGPLARFTPKKAGTFTFQVRANDGKVDSAPAEVKVQVLKAGTLPVAVATAYFGEKECSLTVPAKCAKRGVQNDPNIIVLNGTQSRPQNKALTYTWKQVSGDDLRLNPANMAKERIGLRIFQPGTYKFQLVVSDGENTSQAAQVEFKVDEEASGAKQPDVFSPDDKEKKGRSNLDLENRLREDGALLPPPKDATTSTPADNAATAAALKDLDELSRKLDPEAEKLLLEKLADENKDVRTAAAAALYKRGINGIPALIGALESKNANARNAAYKALTELTHESIGQDPEAWKKWWAQQPAAKLTATP